MEVVNFIRSLRENDVNCKIGYIIGLLNDKYPAANYKNLSKWHHTQIERIIAYYNMPGAKPNYIYKKKKTNINVEDEDSG